MKKEKNEINTASMIIGFVLIGFGVISWLMNWSTGTQAEYVTHQTYYATKEIGNLLIILIGVVLIKK